MGSTEGVAVMLVGWKKGKGCVGVLPCWGFGGKELPVLLPQALESGDGEHRGGVGWEAGSGVFCCFGIPPLGSVCPLMGTAGLGTLARFCLMCGTVGERVAPSPACGHPVVLHQHLGAVGAPHGAASMLYAAVSATVATLSHPNKPSMLGLAVCLGAVCWELKEGSLHP